MARTNFSGPVRGGLLTLTFKLASNADSPKCKAPCNLRVLHVGFYARTSTSGTITLAATTPGTLQASGALTADTPIEVEGTSLTARNIVKGDTISATGGGTLADGTCVVTCLTTGHVVAAGESAD